MTAPDQLKMSRFTYLEIHILWNEVKQKHTKWLNESLTKHLCLLAGQSFHSFWEVPRGSLRCFCKWTWTRDFMLCKCVSMILLLCFCIAYCVYVIQCCRIMLWLCLDVKFWADSFKEYYQPAGRVLGSYCKGRWFDLVANICVYSWLMLWVGLDV